MKRHDTSKVPVEYVTKLNKHEKPARKRRRERRAAERKRALPAKPPKDSWAALWDRIDSRAEEAHGDSDASDYSGSED